MTSAPVMVSVELSELSYGFEVLFDVDFDVYDDGESVGHVVGFEPKSVSNWDSVNEKMDIIPLERGKSGWVSAVDMVTCWLANAVNAENVVNAARDQASDDQDNEHAERMADQERRWEEQREMSNEEWY